MERAMYVIKSKTAVTLGYSGFALVGGGEREGYETIVKYTIASNLFLPLYPYYQLFIPNVR